jgi:hypothetical protein
MGLLGEEEGAILQLTVEGKLGQLQEEEEALDCRMDLVRVGNWVLMKEERCCTSKTAAVVDSNPGAPVVLDCNIPDTGSVEVVGRSGTGFDHN